MCEAARPAKLRQLNIKRWKLICCAVEKSRCMSPLNDFFYSKRLNNTEDLLKRFQHSFHFLSYILSSVEANIGPLKKVKVVKILSLKKEFCSLQFNKTFKAEDAKMYSSNPLLWRIYALKICNFNHYDFDKITILTAYSCLNLSFNFPLCLCRNDFRSFS